MGVLKMKEETLDKKSSIIKEVLEHFDLLEGEIESSVLHKIAAAADNAFSDEILFEEFENWSKSHDDDSFVFLINDYWDSIKKPVLTNRGDITGKDQEITEIKEKAKKEVSKKFAAILNELCAKRNLKTLKEIGDFLGGLSEERVRVLLEGNHKPQRGTILKIAESFNVDAVSLMNQIQS